MQARRTAARARARTGNGAWDPRRRWRRGSLALLARHRLPTTDAWQLLFFCTKATLDPPHVFSGRQRFRANLAVGQDLPNVCITADVLGGDGGFLPQVMLLDLHLRN